MPGIAGRILFPLVLSVALHLAAVLAYFQWLRTAEEVVTATEREVLVELLQATAEPEPITLEKTSVEVSRPQPAPSEAARKTVSSLSEALPVSRLPEPVRVEAEAETPVTRPKEEAPAVVEYRHQSFSAGSSLSAVAHSSEQGALLSEGPLVIAPQRPGVPDEDGLGTFKNAVIGHLERFRNYPRLARDRGISGMVYVQFVIDAEGHVLRVDVLPPRESHPILEQAAMDTIRRASPLPGVPERLKRVSQITLRFAMQYELQ